MPYLIDGHNLIPKLGLRLDSIDDEAELISLLQEFCKRKRKQQVEVYFDGAPAPHAGTRKLGAVTAHFVPLEKTADDAIRKHLKRLGKNAKNWTVVSSDRQVQVEARALHAEVIFSESFAKQLQQSDQPASKVSSDRKLSDDEVNEWLEVFEKKDRRKL
jgi:predicted RNA-binding protein with PIN domain